MPTNAQMINSVISINYKLENKNFYLKMSVISAAYTHVSMDLKFCSYDDVTISFHPRAVTLIIPHRHQCHLLHHRRQHHKLT